MAVEKTDRRSQLLLQELPGHAFSKHAQGSLCDHLPDGMRDGLGDRMVRGVGLLSCTL
jgi:hypothetical protein